MATQIKTSVKTIPCPAWCYRNGKREYCGKFLTRSTETSKHTHTEDGISVQEFNKRKEAAK